MRVILKSEYNPETSPEGQASETAVAEPLYKVVLFNDEEHSYEYVCEMLSRIFDISGVRAFEIAYEVDYLGEATVVICPREKAEAGRDAIHAYGPDPRMPEISRESMRAAVMPAEE